MFFKDPNVWEDVVIAAIVFFVLLAVLRFVAPPAVRDFLALNPSPGLVPGAVK